MKSTAVLMAVILGAAPVLADMTIVQQVESTMMADNLAPTTMTLAIKGSKAKISFKSDTPSSVIDLKAGKIYLINNAAKQVMVMALDQMKAAMEMAGKAMAETGGKMSLQKTENIKTINGFKCREYSMGLGTKGAGQMTCWMAEDIDAKEMEPFREFTLGMARIMGQEPVAQLKGMLIASDSIVKFQGKDIHSRLEVQSISRDPLDDSLFAMPADYQVMELPAMPSMPPPPAATPPPSMPSPKAVAPEGK